MTQGQEPFDMLRIKKSPGAVRRGGVKGAVRNSPISNQSLLDGMVQGLSLRVSGAMCELLAPESGWGLELLGEGEGNEDTADHHGDLGPDEQEFSSCNV